MGIFSDTRLEEREIQIKSCRYVDYYFVYSSESSLYAALCEIKPDIRFLGNDYVGKPYTGDNLNIPVYYHPRSSHTYSTTNLRKLIYLRELSKLKIDN